VGISQQIGASSLIKPGVIDNTAARPASPYEGQVIFQKDTDQLLVWNGTAWVIPNSPAQNPGGLELITTCTVTSAGGTSATASGGVVTIGTSNTSVTVSSAFSSTYDNYKIIVSGGVGSDDPSNLLMTLGSTSTNYYWARVGRSFADVDGGGASGGSTSSWRIGGTSPQTLNMSAEIFSPFLADQTSFASSNLYARTAGSIYFVGGYLNDTTSYTAFTLTAGSGTLTGGTITVYGYRK
jgi:hypothetical protein